MKVNFGIDKKAIKELAKALNKALANTYALYVNTLHCHWNIEDPRFLFLHKMLEDQYKQLAENGDEIAERIRQMGEKVDASLSSFAKSADIKPIGDKASTNQMLTKLAASHENIILDLRDLTELAEDHKDYGLVDLLGSLLRDHEKTAWFIRSHL